MRRLITGDWRDWLSVVCSCDLGHPVVGAGLRGARALRRCVFAVGGDRDRALGGDEAAFGRRAALVVVELPADLPAGVGAEQAGDLGLVLEGLTVRARGGGLPVIPRRRRRADLRRIIGAAGGGGLVGLVGRLGCLPVAGAGRGRPPFPTRRSSDLGGDRDRALGGDEAAFGRRAALVVVELPADLPAGVGAEQAGDLGLVLEGLTDRARGGVLAGFDRRRRRGDLNRLIGAAGGGFLVVLVARVGGHPVVGAELGRAHV